MKNSEKFKNEYSIDLYLIQLMNQIYLLLKYLEGSKKIKYQNKFHRIMEDYEVTNSIFKELEGDLFNNAPYQAMMYQKLKLIEKNLEHFKNSLLKEQMNITSNSLVVVINEMNQFISDFHISQFGLLTKKVGALFGNLNREDQTFISKQIGLLFISVLSFKENQIDTIIYEVDPIFYDVILNIGEYYLFDVMKINNKKEWINKKYSLSKEEYIILLMNEAFSNYYIQHRTSYLR